MRHHKTWNKKKCVHKKKNYALYQHVAQFILQVQTSPHTSGNCTSMSQGNLKLPGSGLLHTFGHSYWRQALVIKRWDKNNNKAPHRDQTKLHQTRLHLLIFFWNDTEHKSTESQQDVNPLPELIQSAKFHVGRDWVKPITTLCIWGNCLKEKMGTIGQLFT